jgi:hypothetical protein
MEDIINFIEFAVEEATIHHDLDGNPSIDNQTLTNILVEYITKRETKLKKTIVKEAREAIQNLLTK